MSFDIQKLKSIKRVSPPLVLKRGEKDEHSKGKINLIKNKMLELKIDIVILSVYSVLSIIFTYPVAFSANKIPGDGGDSYWFLWDLWWFRKTILNSTYTYYTQKIYFPIGVDMGFSDISLINIVVSMPIQPVLGLVGTYNLLWILTFALSGFGAFLLVKYLTSDVRSAFVSGLIFAFCPYHFAHALGHLNLISTQFIPIYILFFIKMIKEPKKSNAVYAGLFLLLSAFSSYYYLAYLIVFTLAYLGYRQMADRNVWNADLAKRLFLAAAVFTISASPFLFPIVRGILGKESTFVYAGGFVEFSADLLGFFIPASFHPLFKDVFAPIYANFTGGPAENTVFLGYTALILSTIAYLKRTDDAKLWATLSALFFILSLGPVLHFNGIVHISFYEHSLPIPLPYSVLAYIPIFSIFRVPARWDILLMLCISVLSGYGLNYISSGLDKQSLSKSNLLYIAISCLILFEYLSIPYPMTSTEVPLFYKEISQESGDFAIMDIPTWFFPDYMFFQTVHGKNLVEGYVSRAPDYIFRYFDSMPFINQLIHLHGSRSGADILDQSFGGIGRDVLNKYDIKYVVLHKNRMPKEDLDHAQTLLQSALGEKPIEYDNGSLIVYEVKEKLVDAATPTTLRALGEGWSGLELWDGVPTRWMGQNATIVLDSPENRTVILSCQALSFYQSRNMTVYINEVPDKSIEVPAEDFVSVKAQLSLNKGTNLIRFNSLKECQSPRSIFGPENKDSRCLGLAIRNITIYRIDDITIF